jgi:hypothetical protein
MAEQTNHNKKKISKESCVNDFKNRIFNTKENMDFSNYVFEGFANFSNSKFEGPFDVDFSRAVFLRGASFENVKFGKDWNRFFDKREITFSIEEYQDATFSFKVYEIIRKKDGTINKNTLGVFEDSNELKEIAKQNDFNDNTIKKIQSAFRIFQYNPKKVLFSNSRFGDMDITNIKNATKQTFITKEKKRVSKLFGKEYYKANDSLKKFKNFYQNASDNAKIQHQKTKFSDQEPYFQSLNESDRTDIQVILCRYLKRKEVLKFISGRGDILFSNTFFFNQMQVSFEESIFLNEKVSFSLIDFHNQGNVSFDLAKFFNLNKVSFSFTKFNNQGNVSFKSVRFQTQASVFFYSTQFNNHGQISFELTTFFNQSFVMFESIKFYNYGNVSFESVKFLNPGAVIYKLSEFHNEHAVSFRSAKFYNKGYVSFDSSIFYNNGIVTYKSSEFHNQDHVSFDSSQFHNQNEVIFNDAKFQNRGNVSFRYSKFENTGKVSFNTTKFQNKNAVSFDLAKFYNKNHVHFITTEFHNRGSVSLFKTEFHNQGDVNFALVSFYNTDEVAFNFTNFKSSGSIIFFGVLWSNSKDIIFDNSLFGDSISVNFTECFFISEGNISFQEVRFPLEGSCQFKRCFFSKTKQVDFTSCNFHHTTFEGGQVQPHKDFYFNLDQKTKEQFRELEIIDANDGPIFKNVFDKKVKILWNSLTTESAKNLTFRLTNFSGSKFDGMTLSHIELNAPNWDESLGRQALAEEITLKERNKISANIQELRDLEDQYTQLKNNLEQKGNYQNAGDFHYGEQEIRRKIVWLKIWEKSSFENFGLEIWAKFKLLGFWALTTFYKISSGYGESTFRAIFIFFIMLFSLAWFLDSFIVGFDLIKWKNFFTTDRPNYFKTVVKLITPFSWRNDLLPNNDFSWDKVFLVFSQFGLLGVQLPLMVMAIRRRFKR